MLVGTSETEVLIGVIITDLKEIGCVVVESICLKVLSSGGLF
jgi:hypothetical protein